MKTSINFKRILNIDTILGARPLYPNEDFNALILERNNIFMNLSSLERTEYMNILNEYANYYKGV